VSKNGRDAPVVRIRVKERIAAGERPARAASGGLDKIVLVIVGACLGLGIGYLLAGRLFRLLRPPIAVVRPVAGEARPGAVAGPTPAAGAMEFDLPAEGE
jgi:hypothetical protein